VSTIAKCLHALIYVIVKFYSQFALSLIMCFVSFF
jgi:hypothetical protein